MLSSEVPVGEGCAEFPAVEKDPRVPTPLPSLFLSVSISFAPPENSESMGGSDRRVVRAYGNNDRSLSFSSLSLSLFRRVPTGSGLLPARELPRERKYDGRLVGRKRRRRGGNTYAACHVDDEPDTRQSAIVHVMGVRLVSRLNRERVRSSET